MAVLRIRDLDELPDEIDPTKKEVSSNPDEIDPTKKEVSSMQCMVDLLFVQRLFVQSYSFNPNLIGLDEKVLDEEWAHGNVYMHNTISFL